MAGGGARVYHRPGDGVTRATECCSRGKQQGTPTQLLVDLCSYIDLLHTWGPVFQLANLHTAAAYQNLFPFSLST